MNEWYYGVYNEKLYRFRIEQDESPWSPREDTDCNVGHMMCWYRGYSLGDKHDYNYPEDFLDEKIRETYKTKDPDNMSYAEKMNALERRGYYFLPLAVYEHSGITIWVGSRWNHFDAQWDCSDVGFIYTTKEEIFKAGGMIKGKRGYIKVTDRNWKKAADEWLRGEVEQYDMYLSGEVYGYISEVFDGEDWNDDDSCWGYYSNKWGRNLIEELALEAIGTDKIYDEDEAQELIKEFEIMSQADTVIAI